LNPVQEQLGPGHQSIDLPKYDGGRVRVDLVGWWLDANVAAAQEVGADQRPDGVAVPAGLPGAFRNPRDK
jgi:hypothetical protein